MRPSILAFVFALSPVPFLLAGPAPAHAQVPVRVEVPIREVVLSDGARRYAVPIRVGETAVEAGLDTGSSGLRILPGVLRPDDAAQTGTADTYAYGSGAKLDGVQGKATVSVGALSAATRVELIHKVGCSADKPGCAAGKVALKDYGIQGDGLPGEGFKAILGINMADAAIPSLFSGIGARRWIVELPRPGEGAPGRIVLNPTDEEMSGYVRLHVLPQFSRQEGGLHDAVQGCVQNVQTKQSLCGALLMDCGAPGVRVEAAHPGPAWAAETPAVLALLDNGKVVAAARFSTDLKAHASKLTFVDQPEGRGRPQAIYAGLLPYFVWSVMYDPAAGVVAVKPRPPTPGGPAAAPLS